MTDFTTTNQNSRITPAAIPTKVAVVGAGSWGTALAFALARNDHDVSLWARSNEHVLEMQQQGSNERYLPGFKFPSNLHAHADLARLTKEHNVFLIGTPSHAFRSIVQTLKFYGLSSDAVLMWATKGFDMGSAEGGSSDQNQSSGAMLLNDVVSQELGAGFAQAIVSGPSFSKEVAANLPTAITAAGNNESTVRYVAELFHDPMMRVYINDDFIGVQVGGAIKNVMAIAAGISDGLGYGANSRSAIITRGLAEIARLGQALGANRETFLGLAGMGDLVLTCTDNQSRNRRFGLGVGEGKSVEQILSEIGQEVEGYTTCKEVRRLAKQHNVDMPISEQVYKVVYEGVSPQDAVQKLLNRELINE